MNAPAHRIEYLGRFWRSQPLEIGLETLDGEFASEELLDDSGEVPQHGGRTEMVLPGLGHE